MEGAIAECLSTGNIEILSKHKVNGYHVDTLRALLDGGMDPNFVCLEKFKTTLLLRQISHVGQDAAEQLAAVELLLDRGASIDNKNSAGESVLHRAAWRGNAHLILPLIRRGANINARSDSGRTPLHEACLGNHLECVRVLVEAGADIQARSLKGEMPAGTAKRKKHWVIWHYLDNAIPNYIRAWDKAIVRCRRTDSDIESVLTIVDLVCGTRRMQLLK